MDVFAVTKAVSEACELARSGKGPTLLEMKTYRYRGHSMSDPAKYRSREEVDETRENKDPIEKLKQYVMKNKILSEVAIKEIEEKVEKIVEESVQFSINSSEPSLSELHTNVYTE
jgi:pyruvate dehydrogenase E1 component alpha subunit